MAPSYQTFVDYALFNGAFSNTDQYPESLVTALLELTHEQEGCKWSEKAILLLTAHRLEIMSRSGIATPAQTGSTSTGGSSTGGAALGTTGIEKFIAAGSTVSSFNIAQGNSSVSFTPPSSSEGTESKFGIGKGENLASTFWGQLLLGMRPNTFAVGFVL